MVLLTRGISLSKPIKFGDRSIGIMWEAGRNATTGFPPKRWLSRAKHNLDGQSMEHRSPGFAQYVHGTIARAEYEFNRACACHDITFQLTRNFVEH
jgi:hypothetical protein